MAEVPWGYRRLWASGRVRVKALRENALAFDAIWPDPYPRRWDPRVFEGSLAQRAVEEVYAKARAEEEAVA